MIYSIGLVLKNALDSRDSAKKVRGLGHVVFLIRIRPTTGGLLRRGIAMLTVYCTYVAG